MTTMRGFAAGAVERDKRGGLRIDVELTTMICSSQIRKISAAMLDISTRGCRLATPITLSTGDFLTVAIPGFSPLGARVCWRRDAIVGLKFAQSLHASVVDHIVATARSARPADAGSAWAATPSPVEPS